MLKLTELKIDSKSSTSITVSWATDPKIKATSHKLNVKEHANSVKDLGTATISKEAIGYTITDLVPNTLYELSICAVSKGIQFSWSFPVAAITLNPEQNILVKSERLLSSSSSETSEILRARNTKDWKEFTNSGYTIASPPELRSLKLQRLLLYVKSLELFEGTFDLEDDYFQGPFYRSNH